VAALVSVGIPTYNRRELAVRAVRSVLAQDHQELEVIVSDDASPDDTAAAIEAIGDPRVRFTRQPVNLGHAANYDWVLRQARGEYFMWLADDDHLGPGYVRRCLEELGRGAVLAAGLARYTFEDGREIDERPTDLHDARPGARLVRFFANVNMNGALFGLARRRDWEGFPDEIGGDWMLVGEMALKGRVSTLRDVRLHRSASGISADPERFARDWGLEGLAARHHHLVVARNVVRRFGARAPVAARLAALTLLRYPALDYARRAGLGVLEPRISAWLRSRG
jgi:glycosyltransferase involved in cell wall biosynthesis